MNLKEAIKKRNMQLLAAKINENGGQAVPEMDSILNNLPLLAEKGESFGEETKFIRLDVLRLLGTLNETGRLIFKILPETITWAPDRSVVSLGGYLVDVSADGNEIPVSGFSCGGAALEDVYSSEMMSDARRMSSMLSLASARAEKAAYQNAGIGIEFKGDVFDLEASEAMIPAPKPVLPSPVSQDEKKARKRKKKEEEPKEQPVDPELETTKETAEETLAAIVNVPENVPEETVFGAESTEPEPEPAPANNSEMTLDVALKFVVDTGVNKGKSFAEIDANKATWRHFVWLKKNPPATGRDADTEKALDLIIASHPELAPFM